MRPWNITLIPWKNNPRNWRRNRNRNLRLWTRRTLSNLQPRLRLDREIPPRHQKHPHRRRQPNLPHLSHQLRLDPLHLKSQNRPIIADRHQILVVRIRLHLSQNSRPTSSSSALACVQWSCVSCYGRLAGELRSVGNRDCAIPFLVSSLIFLDSFGRSYSRCCSQSPHGHFSSSVFLVSFGFGLSSRSSGSLLLRPFYDP